MGREGSKSIINQQKRWDRILTKWEEAAALGLEIITMGDVNLNSLSWNLPEEQKSPQDRLQSKMSNMLQERILDKGFTLVGSQPTRAPDRPDSRLAALDLIFTNRIDRVESFEIGLLSFSDHLIQSLARRTKKLEIIQQRIRVRTFKNFSKESYRENVRNHELYIETLYEKQPDVITENLQQIINDSLRELAPIRNIQIDSTNCTKLSEKARTLLAFRDAALTNMKSSPTIENIREYKHLRSQANKEISIEKWKSSAEKFGGEKLSVTDKWKAAKLFTGQRSFKSPVSIIEGKQHHMSPGNMAAALNRLYIKK